MLLICLILLSLSLFLSVTSFKNMFTNAEQFNQDIGSWDVSQSKRFANMFGSAYNFNQNLNGWDMSRAEWAHGMFTRTSSFNQPLAAWDCSRMKQISYFFRDSAFNQDIQAWDVSRVTRFYSMFQDSIFNKPLAAWDTSSGYNMNNMFYRSSFTQNLSAWSVGNVEYCEEFSNPGCNPSFLHQLGCVENCCATQVADSDHDALNSISMSLGDAPLKVECDLGFTGSAEVGCIRDSNNVSVYDMLPFCTGTLAPSFSIFS